MNKQPSSDHLVLMLVVLSVLMASVAVGKHQVVNHTSPGRPHPWAAYLP